MRFIMQVTFPAEPFNKIVTDGTAGRTMARLLEEIRPEAVYFAAKDGKRTAFLIVNMDRTSEMPRLAEPFFVTLNADVQFYPTMTAEDLKAANIDELGKKWK